MERRRRACKRLLLKLPAEVTADGLSFAGRTVRVSEKGLFIRSQNSFREGVRVNIKLMLPDGKESTIKGVVRYARRINFMPLLNGMGIEITEGDSDYFSLIRSLKKELGYV